MSDRNRHQPAGPRRALLAAAAAFALLAPAPAAAADDCAPMSAHFVFCAEGSEWAGARWIQFGDGSALELGPYYVEFAEHWAGRNASAEQGGTLEGALDALLAMMAEAEHDEGMQPPALLMRDQFDTEALTVVRAVKQIDMDDDEPLLMATMIAQGEGARIAVIFGNDDETDAAELAQQARGFVALIRPGQEG